MNLKIENWKLLILSIFYLIFSILSYTIEKEKFLNFFQIAGIAIILAGLFQILVYFFKKEYMKPNEFSFSFGVLYCIAGLIVATKPYLIVDNYPIVISGLVVLDATLRLQYSMNLFRLQDAQWIANFYTILYYRGVARRYGRHSEQILDLSSQEAAVHEVIDGKDNMVD